MNCKQTCVHTWLSRCPFVHGSGRSLIQRAPSGERRARLRCSMVPVPKPEATKSKKRWGGKEQPSPTSSKSPTSNATTRTRCDTIRHIANLPVSLSLSGSSEIRPLHFNSHLSRNQGVLCRSSKAEGGLEGCKPSMGTFTYHRARALRYRSSAHQVFRTRQAPSGQATQPTLSCPRDPRS